MRLISDDTLRYISNPFVYIERVILITYITVYLGLISYKPSYITILSTWFPIIICIFLMYKFNPFRKHTLDKNDGRTIFTSAVFMLTNILIT